jgi:hypothetical protein
MNIKKTELSQKKPLTQFLPELRLKKYCYLSDSLSNGCLLRWLSVHLITGRIKRGLDVRHVFELGMRLVARVAEVLDLGHGELAHADEARTRRNLVSESVTNLRGCEW